MTVNVIDTLPIKHLEWNHTFRVGLTPAPTCLRGKVVKLIANVAFRGNQADSSVKPSL
jgi:hypothetical protein